MQTPSTESPSSAPEEPPAFGELIVHVESGAHCAARIDLAVHVAEYLKAQVVGVYARGPALLPLAGDALSGVQAETVTAPESMQYNVRIAHADARAAEDLFRSILAGRMPKPRWCVMAGRAVDVLVAYARYADLVIVGQTAAGSTDIVGEVVLRSGRPLLVAPYVDRFPVTMARVLVAWDASREAARALSDALPMLRRARQVTVLSIGPAEKLPPGADIIRYLSNHRIDAASLRKDTASDAGAVVLDVARALKSDLLVMGAYGRSRLRERVLGGTTQNVLEHIHIPVLVSH